MCTNTLRYIRFGLVGEILDETSTSDAKETRRNRYRFSNAWARDVNAGINS
jgi:hypothetical protein